MLIVAMLLFIWVTIDSVNVKLRQIEGDNCGGIETIPFFPR